MCTNYRPTSRDLIAERLHVADPGFEYEPEAWPSYAAPVVREREGARECLKACFGLIPYWSKDMKIARTTTNARSETVHEKPSFRQAWARRQWCLVPMDGFFEPSYESGRAVRWRFERVDRAPFFVAGLWERWVAPATREVVHSFSMLTINADAHPLMKRFHKPGEEKRSLVVVPDARAADWLNADHADARALLEPFDAEAFTASADPVPKRGTGQAESAHG